MSSTSGYWCSVHGAYTPDTLIGCPACRSQPRSVGAVEAATMLAHHHRWVFDGRDGPYYVYHCDDHDPPVVRVVWHSEDDVTGETT
jgi:hypothetical protein